MKALIAVPRMAKTMMEPMFAKKFPANGLIRYRKAARTTKIASIQCFGSLLVSMRIRRPGTDPDPAF
jgi:hypothetical protein